MLYCVERPYAKRTYILCNKMILRWLRWAVSDMFHKYILENVMKYVFYVCLLTYQVKFFVDLFLLRKKAEAIT